jgi:3-oxoacyl-[acyl-carrier protein] reductase
MGGGRGIGRAICLGLAEEGADIVVADIQPDSAKETVAMVIELGRKAVFIKTDVSDEQSIKRVFERAVADFATVDILVNNAGICRMIPILDIEVAEWDEIMAVNLRGTFLMSREAFRIMKENKRGKIINVASAAAKTGGLAAGAHYSASKAGVICFTKSLALQAAPFKVNVNAVCPGPTSTEMTDAWGDETNKAFAAHIPWKEYARPEDIANAVVFLASDNSRYMTGEIMDINGGLVMD